MAGSAVAMGQVSVRGSLWAAALFSLALFFIYYETIWSIVYIWSRSDTFAHGFLIFPISIWLIWTRRNLLENLRPAPVLWVALITIPLGVVWLLGWLVDVSVIQQLALIAMLVVGAWAIMGHQLTRLLVFPLLFLFFAVPMGEGLIPPMQQFTALSAVWMIEMTGIPVYREGLIFTLPSGRWEVVQACSGVRYIIASVTIGTLYAYLTYRSWPRRLLFVIASAIVPVLANSVRAYIIVMLGHVSDMTVAVGADHLVYGWLFFGLVIFVLFWLGSFFREDHLVQAATHRDIKAPGSDLSGSNLKLLLVFCTTLMIVALAPFLARTALDNSGYEAREVISFPETAGLWQTSAAASWRWAPPSRVSGQQVAHFGHDGETLRLFLQFPDGVLDSTDVIGSSARFDRWRSGWNVAVQNKVTVVVPGGAIAVDEAQMRSRDVELLVWSWYLIGDFSTSNDYQAKVHQALARLGRGEAGATRIVVAIPMQSSLAATRSRLQSFVDEYVPLLNQELRQADVKVP
jgi:exosortase A